MKNFFIQIMDFTDGPRPPFPFEGSWLYSDNQPVLHLVSSSALEISQQEYLQPDQQGQQGQLLDSHSALPSDLISQNLIDQNLIGKSLIDHIAFQGDSYSALIQRLNQHQATYFERTIPLSNEHQVFIIGPEQIKLEILFNQNKTPLA